jgi:chemotaxis regulatin CheY-phosphate phosphatase CheZ
MITFKLDDKSAEAMVSVLNAVHPDATFVQDLTAQYVKATAVVVEEVPAELIKVIEEPLVNKKTKVAAPAESA